VDNGRVLIKMLRRAVRFGMEEEEEEEEEEDLEEDLGAERSNIWRKWGWLGAIVVSSDNSKLLCRQM
jgi:hypothetical protein